MTQETVDIRRSIQGPVVYDEGGLTLAMRVAGIDRPRMLEQWFKMGEATNLEQFKDALRVMSVPMWHANYADDQGHIMFVFDGLVPKRKGHDYDYWNKIVPGDTSETMWSDYLTFDELPKSIDPPAGWNHNTNEPPWDVTVPPLDRTKYAPYVAPTGLAQPQMRVLRSRRMITEDPKISYDQLIAKKHSTRMELADKVLPDLLKAADGKTEAARVLEKWDHLTEADSRGAVLFQMFAAKYFAGPGGVASKMRVKFDFDHPHDSAYGLERSGRGAGDARDCRRGGAADLRSARREVGRRLPARQRRRGHAGQRRSRRFGAVQNDRLYAQGREPVLRGQRRDDRLRDRVRQTQQARCTLGLRQFEPDRLTASLGSDSADVAEGASPGVARPQGYRGRTWRSAKRSERRSETKRAPLRGAMPLFVRVLSADGFLDLPAYCAGCAEPVVLAFCH